MQGDACSVDVKREERVIQAAHNHVLFISSFIHSPHPSPHRCSLRRVQTSKDPQTLCLLLSDGQGRILVRDDLRLVLPTRINPPSEVINRS